MRACADPENIARGGPTLTTYFLFLREEDTNKYNYKQSIIGQPAKQHLNVATLACQ